MGGNAVMERRSLMLSSPNSAMGSHVSIRRLVICGGESWVGSLGPVHDSPWVISLWA